MPITLPITPPDTPFGPGFNLLFQTDMTGPLPIDHTWRVEITPVGQETNVIYVQDLQVQAHSSGLIFLKSDDITSPLQPAFKPIVEGDPVRLLVKRLEGGVVVESLSQTMVWDMTSGIPYLQQSAAAADVGFTAEDRVVLMQLKGNLFWTLFGVLVEELVELGTGLVATPWVPLLVADPLCQEANFARPPLVPLARWIGMRWEVISWPAGLGIVDGNPDHSYATWGQLSLARTNTDGVSAVYDTRYESRLKGEILWGTAEPETFQVYLLPGVCIRLWSLAGPPWVLAGDVANANAGISSDKPKSV